MYIIIEILQWAAIVSGLIFWLLETRRRKGIEDELLRLLKDDLAGLKISHEEYIKLLKGYKFLYNRSKLHRDLIESLIKDVKTQEIHFSKFGEIIALFGERLIPDPKVRLKRLGKLKRKMVSSSS